MQYNAWILAIDNLLASIWYIRLSVGITPNVCQRHVYYIEFNECKIYKRTYASIHRYIHMYTFPRTKRTNTLRSQE